MAVSHLLASRALSIGANFKGDERSARRDDRKRGATRLHHLHTRAVETELDRWRRHGGRTGRDGGVRTKVAGPQLVPGWMLQAGWDELSAAGRLSQTDLLERLNVKRSAAVMAILARLPGVLITSLKPTVLKRS